MTGTYAPARRQPLAARPQPVLAAARLMWLELRHNAMLWVLPVAIALFWFTTYRKVMAMPPLWYPRATSMQTLALADFVCPVVGAAAWMGSREARRRLNDLAGITARPRWARLLTAWAATTCWAAAGYLGCVAVLYGMTARQASSGGPLWWPVIVVVAGLAAFSALGFAAGVVLPSRFTAPAAAIVSFFTLVLSTELITGSRSYWQISPVVAGPWDIGPDEGAATFYHYLPDLSIAQVMFLSGLTVAVLAAALALPGSAGARRLRAIAATITAAGLLAAGTAVALAGTSRLDARGMIAIPALHDAASDQPIRFTPVCSHTAIPVCLNPAYARSLPATAAALRPVLSELRGLPGAPARISQTAAVYQQELGNNVAIGLTGPLLRGQPPVYFLLLPDQVLGAPLTASQLAGQVRASAGPDIVASVIGDGPGASQAQRAVEAALIIAAGQSPQRVVPVRCRSRAAPCSSSPPADGAGLIDLPPVPVPGSPAAAAAARFAALPAPVRHAWLVLHLAALRAGRITVDQLP